jgi:hypothetical protein
MENRANGVRSPVRPEKRTKDDDEHKHDEEWTMALKTYQSEIDPLLSLGIGRRLSRVRRDALLTNRQAVRMCLAPFGGWS